MCECERWSGQQHKIGRGRRGVKGGDSRRLRGKARRRAHLERRLHLFSRDVRRLERWRWGQRMCGERADKRSACNGLVRIVYKGHAAGIGPNGFAHQKRR